MDVNIDVRMHVLVFPRFHLKILTLTKSLPRESAGFRYQAEQFRRLSHYDAALVVVGDDGARYVRPVWSRYHKGSPVFRHCNGRVRRTQVYPNCPCCGQTASSLLLS